MCFGYGLRLYGGTKSWYGTTRRARYVLLEDREGILDINWGQVCRNSLIERVEL